MSWSFVLLAVVSVGALSGASAAGDERALLAAQRQQIEETARQARQACAVRFDVAGCEAAIRRERSAALAPLLQREHDLADQERKARSEQQQQRVRDKLRDADLQEVQQQARAAAASGPGDATPHSAAPSNRLIRPDRPVPADAKALEQARQEQAQRATERAERQRLRSLDRRQQLEQRQAEKASKAAADAKATAASTPADARRAAKPAAGLPVPNAAEVAALRASAASSKPRP